MKLLRFGLNGYEKPGLLDSSGRIRDLSGVVDQIDSLHLAPRELKKLAQVKARIAAARLRLAATRCAVHRHRQVHRYRA